MSKVPRRAYFAYWFHASGLRKLHMLQCILFALAFQVFANFWNTGHIVGTTDFLWVLHIFSIFLHILRICGYDSCFRLKLPSLVNVVFP